jgi:hypothetical protein
MILIYVIFSRRNKLKKWKKKSVLKQANDCKLWQSNIIEHTYLFGEDASKETIWIRMFVLG